MTLKITCIGLRKEQLDKLDKIKNATGMSRARIIRASLDDHFDLIDWDKINEIHRLRNTYKSQ